MNPKDLSLKNKDILQFFLGDDSNPPVRELLYLHERPLEQNSFLKDINLEINNALKKLKANNVSNTDPFMEELQDMCVNLSLSIGDLKIKDSLYTLHILRELWQLAKHIERTLP